jgi:DNA-binding NtrC family response regulator
VAGERAAAQERDREHGRAQPGRSCRREPAADIRPAGGDVPLGGMSNLVGISLEQAEKELIRNTLNSVNGNREQAARILRIGERTLYRKIKEYDLT